MTAVYTYVHTSPTYLVGYWVALLGTLLCAGGRGYQIVFSTYSYVQDHCSPQILPALIFDTTAIQSRISPKSSTKRTRGEQHVYHLKAVELMFMIPIILMDNAPWLM